MKAAAALWLAPMLSLMPCAAHAMGDGRTRVFLNAGGCFMPTPLTYELAQFSETGFAIDDGVIAPLSPPARAFIELQYARFTMGPNPDLRSATSSYGADLNPSHIMTAMAGVMIDRSPAAAGPFALAGAGAGRILLGNLSHGDASASGASGPSRTVPAFEIGVGARTGSLRGGPQVSLTVRVITILADDPTTTIVPVTIGVAF